MLAQRLKKALKGRGHCCDESSKFRWRRYFSWREFLLIYAISFPRRQRCSRYSEFSAKVRKAEMGDDSARTYFCGL